jgi:hypothetical protein
MAPEEYLNERLEKQINWYSSKSKLNKQWYQALKTSEIVLAAITPFIVALVSGDTNFLKYVAGAMSIIIGILAGLLTAFKFHEKWIQYRSTCENLNHEKYLFETNSSIYTTNSSFNLFVERVEFIISKENSDWTQIIVSSEVKNTKPQNEIDSQP